MPDFKSIQDKWQKAWSDAGIFKVKEDKHKKKFYCLEMFPYPSGSFLHMGHVRNYSIGDVIARYKRLKGFNVLYPMGFDSFGLPAENAAKKEKIHPREYTENAIAKIVEYMKQLGLSYDWDRIIASHRPEYYKWNQYFFVKFFEKGLAYRKKASVNFCESCNTVLANEEVDNGKCWRCESIVVNKELDQWFLKTTAYTEELLNDIKKLEWSDKIKSIQENWIGKSHGLMISFKLDDGTDFPIFTTRPDTIYGVTFMVIALNHPRLIGMLHDPYKKNVQDFIKEVEEAELKDDMDFLEKSGVFTGRYVINPLNNEKVPLYAGNFVLSDYATGAIMAVPAHDQRDFEFAKKYNIPIKIVIQNKDHTLKLKDMEKIIQKTGFKIDGKSKDWLINMANGDARQAITMLENTSNLYGKITTENLKNALQSKFLRYDKKGEEHYNIISAFIKSMRASQPDAALYYLARMIDAGEDPKFIARRMVIFASEDIGLVQPTALVVANEVFRAVETIGLPECGINLAHGTVYLSNCKKDRSAYNGYILAMADVKKHGNLPVPLNLRNAPTQLMKDLGYAEGYEKYSKESFLPDKLKKKKYL